MKSNRTLHNILYFIAGTFLGVLLLATILSIQPSEPPSPTPSSKLPPSVSPPTLQEFSTFPNAILQATGKKVLPYDETDTVHEEIRSTLIKSAEEICIELSKEDSPIKGLNRINEASKFVENLLLKKLNHAQGLTCIIPKNAQGKEQRAGYPDLLLTHQESGKKFYLDPKLYELSSEGATLRTFYFSPHSKSGKIHHNATHLLLGFSHDGKDGDWTILGVKLLDLHPLSLRLKSEYNASNADLYKKGIIITQSGEHSGH